MHFKDTNRLKVKGWKYIYHIHTNKKKCKVDILILIDHILDQKSNLNVCKRPQVM